MTVEDTLNAASLADAAPAGHAGAVSNDAASDDALMLRYCAGDAASFDILYERYRARVFRFFLRQIPRTDAEECHQDVWLKLINGRMQYQPRGEFRAYLFTIAHRTLTDRHRRSMKHAVIDADAAVEEIADAVADPQTAAMERRDIEYLYRGIATLPIAQREALLMKESAGLSLAEIARITETTEEGVKSRLRYATQKLRRILTES